MSKTVTVDVPAIVERIKLAYGLRFNADVARHLGMKPEADPVGQAIRRNTINLLRVVNSCPDVSADWLIYGRGPMRVDDEVSGFIPLSTSVSDPDSVIDQIEALIDRYRSH